MAKDEGSLKRLGGGRWQTRDGRFTIEPQSGTWAVVDSESTDDLGLPLVRGPYGSLAAARAAIAEVRDGAAPESPLTERLARAPAPSTPRRGGSSKASTKAPDKAPARPAPPPEPRWLTDLPPGDRRRARELLVRVEAAGLDDPEAIVRDEVARGRPALARAVLARHLQALGADADPDAVVELLIDGSDRALDVRWRLVDGDGRPIGDLPRARR